MEKDKHSMARIAPLTALLCASTLAAGCANSNAPLSAAHNPSLYSIHQPVVQPTDYVLHLAVPGGGLPAHEADRLDAWFQGLEVGYGDRISIDEAGGYGDPRLRDDIAAVAAPYGLLVSQGTPITAGAVQPGSVRIVVSRMTASVPGCPDWGYAKRPGGPSTTDSNYGCAINSNLAAMIADPADLVLGQVGAGDARVGTKAVKAYRDRIPTGVSGTVKSEGK